MASMPASNSGSRSLRAMRAILAIGAALSIGSGMAFAGDDVTADQILKALAPKEPLTRGLSMAPPADPVVTTPEGKFVDSLRNRDARSLSLAERGAHYIETMAVSAMSTALRAAQRSPVTIAPGPSRPGPSGE